MFKHFLVHWSSWFHFSKNSSRNLFCLWNINIVINGYISGVQTHSLCRHNCGDKDCAVATFVGIWEIWSVFFMINPILNNCLSPHLNSLLPHVANGDTGLDIKSVIKMLSRSRFYFIIFLSKIIRFPNLKNQPVNTRVRPTDTKSHVFG